MFIMCLIGIIYVNLNKKRRKYSLFFNIVLAIYLVLIILGKLALSPSRHTMVLIPILIYYMLYGFEFISKKYLKITNWLIIILAISINFIFFFDFKTEYKNRINPINTKYFNNLVEKYHPITISSVYWLNYSTNYLKLPGYIDGKTGTTRTLINKENSNNNIILIYDIDQKLSQERVEQVLNAIDNAKLPVKYKDKKSWKLLYKEETISKTEIEYAYGRFWNYPNSFYCYVIEMEV